MKANLVDDRINTLIGQANLKLSKKVTRLAANYLTLLLRGGHSTCWDRRSTSSGSQNTQRILETIQPELPKDSRLRGRCSA